MRRSLSLLGLVAIAALALSVALWSGGDAAAPGPEPNDAKAPEVEAPSAPPATSTDAASADTATAERTSMREPGGPSSRSFADRLAAWPQGFLGRVVDARQNPLEGVEVYLVESPLNDPASLPVLRQQGLLLGPVGDTRTDAEGRFALGLHLATDKVYELRLLSARHADVRIGDLRTLHGEWHDLGALVMSPGTTVRGLVTVAGTNTPIPFATVSLESSSAFADATLRAIPGREAGHVTRTAADGTFELRHAPEHGSIRLAAVAPGFARALLDGIDLGRGQAVRVHFELEPGLELHGRVADPDGEPIPNARIEAWPQREALPPCTSFSRADGAFVVPGLRDGPHRVRIRARGYQAFERKNVPAGRTDLDVRLLPSAVVAVAVRTPDGHPLHDYRVGLRRWFGTGQGGRVAEVPDQRVRLAKGTSRFDLRGVPRGRFIVQVTAAGWAKTLSAPFDVLPDCTVLPVDVELVAGATLRGIVADASGRPLEGATVRTQPDGTRPDNPLFRMLRHAAPDQIMSLATETADDGSFALPHLAYGAYQLQIDHPSAPRHFVTGIVLQTSTTTDLGRIRLPAGALVAGRATAGGRAGGQIRVVLESVPGSDAKGEESARSIRLETVTDNEGAFVMPRRVPPGDYELRAAVVGREAGQGAVFDAIRQMRRSATRLTVLPGQRRVEHRIDIPPRAQGPR